VPAEVLFDKFASDRSHMVRARRLAAHTLIAEAKLTPVQIVSASVNGGAPTYSRPVPSWPAICGPAALAAGVTTNLMDTFVRMDPAQLGASEHGEVVDLAGFVEWCVRP
jgi:hypothetical protein